MISNNAYTSNICRPQKPRTGDIVLLDSSYSVLLDS